MNVTFNFTSCVHYDTFREFVESQGLGYEYTGYAIGVRTDNALLMTTLMQEYTWIVAGAKY